jgi:hypothetical protein
MAISQPIARSSQDLFWLRLTGYWEHWTEDDHPFGQVRLRVYQLAVMVSVTVMPLLDRAANRVYVDELDLINARIKRYAQLGWSRQHGAFAAWYALANLHVLREFHPP